VWLWHKHGGDHFAAGAQPPPVAAACDEGHGKALTGCNRSRLHRHSATATATVGTTATASATASASATAIDTATVALKNNRFRRIGLRQYLGREKTNKKNKQINTKTEK
jgi:hypothetical protein